MSVQAPSGVVLVRPRHFSVNSSTAADNRFQSNDHGLSAEELARRGYDEATAVAEALVARGIRVHLFEDERDDRPDSVFPNNWFSTHAQGAVVLYPMFSPNRRTERRSDVVEVLRSEYDVERIADYSGLESEGVFLEGTGAMVLDHINRIAYVCRSQRADPVGLERFCNDFEYEAVVFDATDSEGYPVYHTNVVMCIGTEVALVGLDLIDDGAQRAAVEASLLSSGRTLIPLSYQQIESFAGNAMELQADSGSILALSTTAESSLKPDQRTTIEESAELLALQVPTIELSGGSVRCMLAGIHLKPR